MTASLTVADVSAGYDDLYVLEDVTIEVAPGDFVAIVGPNGAGKSTLLKTVVGATTLHDGAITHDGDDITTTPRDEIVHRGIGYVPQEDATFPDLTVWENLRMGAYSSDGDLDDRLADVYELFPRLEERAEQRARTLSGGESRMLAVARALMPDPDILLVDEPSAGLAPQIVDRMFERISEIHAAGTTVVLVEQNVSAALGGADYVYTLTDGRITDEHDADAVDAEELSTFTEP